MFFHLLLIDKDKIIKDKIIIYKYQFKNSF